MSSPHFTFFIDNRWKMDFVDSHNLSEFIYLNKLFMTNLKAYLQTEKKKMIVGTLAVNGFSIFSVLHGAVDWYHIAH